MKFDLPIITGFLLAGTTGETSDVWLSIAIALIVVPLLPAIISNLKEID